MCDGLLLPEETESGIHAACRKKLVWVKEPVCLHCGSPLEQQEREYCYDCAKRSMRMQSPFWDGKPFSSIIQGRAVFVYQGEIKRSMYRFKYSNRREYAHFFAEAACARWGTWMRARGVEAVVAVPMYRKKERHRGYNQAELLARAVAEQMELDFVPNLVRRTRSTAPQKNLNDVERKNNLKNAFQISDFIVQYKRVLLVDDIYTTGSTAEAVAEELREAGVGEVYFLAVCIGKGL